MFLNKYLFVFLFALPLTKLWADPCQNAATGRLETRAQSNKRFLPFNEAMLKAQAAGVSSSRKYNEWQKGHSDMPAHPNKVYPEWQGWGHFLGTGNVRDGKGNFLPFDEARLKAQAAGVSSLAEYNEWQKGHSDMPAAPYRVYPEWQDWGHFLGTGNVKGRGKKNLLSFNEAMLKAQAAGVSSATEYNEWQKGQSDMPARPNQVYAKEWQGWGHFLGTGNVKGRRKKNFLSFNEAMLKAQAAGVSSSREYQKWQKGQSDMPANPNEIYEEWQGWGHFLGTGNVKGRRKKSFLPFNEAMLKAQAAGVSSSRKYNEWHRGQDDMPARPDQVYPEWQGWGHFLGTGNVKGGRRIITGNVKDRRKGNFLPFEEAMLKAQSAGISSSTEYKEWQKGQSDMPSAPNEVYAKEWQGWGPFLGTRRVMGKKENFLPFEEAMLKAQAAGVSSARKYNEWQKGQSDMPANPNLFYAKEWQGWGHFLGTGNVKGRRRGNFLPFEEARLKAQSAGISSSTEYKEWQKGHSDMSSNPNLFYAKEWQGWGHFLGTGNVKGGGRIITGNVKDKRRGNFLPFEKARLKAQSAGISSSTEYKEWQKGHSDMPSAPHQVYAKEWQGWGHFLGTGNVKDKRKGNFLPFEEAMLKAQAAGVSSATEYKEWQKGQSDMPSAPHQVYAKEWQGWGHFLGTGNVKGGGRIITGNVKGGRRIVTGNVKGRKDDFLPFEEAMLKAQAAEAWEHLSQLSLRNQKSLVENFEGLEGYILFADRHFKGDMEKAFLSAKALLSFEFFDQLNWDIFYGSTQLFEDFRNLPLFERGKVREDLKGLKGYVLFSLRITRWNMKTAYMNLKAVLNEDLMSQLEWPYFDGSVRELESLQDYILKKGRDHFIKEFKGAEGFFAFVEQYYWIKKQKGGIVAQQRSYRGQEARALNHVSVALGPYYEQLEWGAVSIQGEMATEPQAM